MSQNRDTQQGKGIADTFYNPENIMLCGEKKSDTKE